MDREMAYNILRINSDATEVEITQAYTKLVRRYPLEAAPNRFREIQEAYTVLKNSAQFWLRKLDEHFIDFRFMQKYFPIDDQVKADISGSDKNRWNRTRIQAMKELWLALYRHT